MSVEARQTTRSRIHGSWDTRPFDSEGCREDDGFTEGGGYDTMDWTEPEYSRGTVDRAGEELLTLNINIDTYPRVTIIGDIPPRTLDVVNNWRFAHAYPLQVIKMNLLNRAKVIARASGSKAIVAQRRKRLESIILKLRNTPGMQLSRMHDIGGCRAVLRSMRQVRELVEVYEESFRKNPNSGHERVRPYDYISTPKDSGYRSFHYVYKYRTTSAHKKCYNGLRIEIQIRSALQHSWATAVETVSTLTKQALKANVGSDHWKRFFALMGSAIALRERTPIVPGTPSNVHEMYEELRHCSELLRVNDVLSAYGYAADIVARKQKDAKVFVVVLDPIRKTVTVSGFTEDELTLAEERFVQEEKNLDLAKGMQAVLIGAESLADLRRGYPNLYLNTRAFLDALNTAVRIRRGVSGTPLAGGGTKRKA